MRPRIAFLFWLFDIPSSLARLERGRVEVCQPRINNCAKDSARYKPASDTDALQM